MKVAQNQQSRLRKKGYPVAVPLASGSAIHFVGSEPTDTVLFVKGCGMSGFFLQFLSSLAEITAAELVSRLGQRVPPDPGKLTPSNLFGDGYENALFRNGMFPRIRR